MNQNIITVSPKIYHITHINNLPAMIECGKIWSDAKRIELGLDYTGIGMNTIKERRLNQIEINCHAGLKVGQFTPFYFCPRSVMLYIIYARNHPDLAYIGGQEPIVHLEFDVQNVVNWATQNNRNWAFSDRNAAASIASFYNNLQDLDKINWDAVKSRDFTNNQIKEGKQAEFLIQDYMPLALIEKIGIINSDMYQQVLKIINGSSITPQIAIEKNWYF